MRPGLVGRDDALYYFVGERQTVQRRFQLIKWHRVENHGTDRLTRESAHACGYPLRPPVGTKQPAVVGLGQIVVFGREPENRDCGNPILGQLLSQPHGSEGFVERVTRSAEESDLLSRDNGDRAGLCQ